MRRMRRTGLDRVVRCNWAVAVGALLISVLSSGCSDGDGSAKTIDATERGRTVYRNVCTACHDADPSQEGAIGPAVAGSSRELLHAKIVKGEYPKGYQPKRAGMAMPRFEYLAEAIEDLAAYLNQTVQTGS